MPLPACGCCSPAAAQKGIWFSSSARPLLRASAHWLFMRPALGAARACSRSLAIAAGGTRLLRSPAVADRRPRLGDVDACMVKTGFDPGTCFENRRLEALLREGNLPAARTLFDRMPLRNTITADMMLSGYLRAGDLRHARLLFDATADRSKITWTLMIAAYAKANEPRRAFLCFAGMVRSGVQPDHVTVVALLGACAGAAKSVAQVHARLSKSGHTSALIVSNTLVDAYCKCGLVRREASRLFDELRCKDSVTFNAMLMGFAKEGCHLRAVELFRDMRGRGLKASQFTFSGLLYAATGTGDLALGLQIHGSVIKTNFGWNVYVNNSLLDFYSKADRMVEAMNLFLEMPRADVVSYNVMISGFASDGQEDFSLQLFRELQFAGFGRKQFPFPTVLSIAATRQHLLMGRQIHGQVILAGAGSDVLVGNSLVDMYAKCGHLETAEMLFAGRTDRNAASWTAMISGHVQNGSYEVALKIFSEMRRNGMNPDRATFSSILRASAGLASAGLGKQLHGCALTSGCAENVCVGSALLDAYAKCGCIAETVQVFEEMPERNVVSWNAMLSAYAHNGRAEDAVGLFREMVGSSVEPDSVSFLGVLSACSHGGLAEEGLQIFHSMRNFYAIEPKKEHYCCVVDALGRVGRLDEAQRFLADIPFEADQVIWASILNSCRIHKNQELARRAADKLFGMELRDATPYMIMSNIYAAAGSWEDVGRVKKRMKDRGVVKEPAFSWVEIDHSVHRFASNDDAHPQIDGIKEALDELSEEMEKHGYLPDTGCALLPPYFFEETYPFTTQNTGRALHDTAEGAEAESPRHHGERLAFASAPTRTPPGLPHPRDGEPACVHRSSRRHQSRLQDRFSELSSKSVESWSTANCINFSNELIKYCQ